MPDITVLESDSDSEKPVSNVKEELKTKKQSLAADSVLSLHPCRIGYEDGMPSRLLSVVINHPAFVRIVTKDAKKASDLKNKGNEYFKQKNYVAALDAYSDALEYAPTAEDYSYSRAVYYCNRAACHLAMGANKRVIEDCTQALELDARYVKAYVRRSQAHEALEDLESALEDMNKVVEIDPTQYNYVAKRNKLQEQVKEKHEALKAEMMDKLKGLGNTILGKFGLSLDNFKAVQDPNTGSYSISFQQ